MTGKQFDVTSPNAYFFVIMKYLSITIHPATVDTIKTSRTCTMTISGVW